MKQLTLRVDERMVERLRAVAAERGESVNAYAGAVLSAAVNPDLAADELEQLRERLARAGLLARPAATGAGAGRPPEGAVARARAEAGRGRALSEIVVEERG
jgi:hypothetical protein